MQPAVLDVAEARGRVVVVAAEDVRALDQDLPVLGDPHLGARQRAADGAEAEFSPVEKVAAVAVSVMP